MKNVRFPDEDKIHNLVFYLAIEEYLSANENADYFFLWQAPPTVIIGRNQILTAEVNEEFCREKGISIYRRKSGGGCVYSDSGNLMVSHISGKVNPQQAFDNYLDKLANALSQLGIGTVKTSNNDLLINGKKVSGNAYYGTLHSSIVHGTLLYNMDLESMTNAITPNEQKIFKHGIKSVRQRVVNLCDLGVKFSLNDIKSHLIKEFCDSEYFMSPKDIERVKEIEQTYLDTDFIRGKE